MLIFLTCFLILRHTPRFTALHRCQSSSSAATSSDRPTISCAVTPSALDCTSRIVPSSKFLRSWFRTRKSIVSFQAVPVQSYAAQFLHAHENNWIHGNTHVHSQGRKTDTAFSYIFHLQKIYRASRQNSAVSPRPARKSISTDHALYIVPGLCEALTPCFHELVSTYPHFCIYPILHSGHINPS